MSTPTDQVALWSRVLDYVEGLPVGDQAYALQMYVQQGGPIPDELDARARKILSRLSNKEEGAS